MFITQRSVRQFSRQLAMLLEAGVALQVAIDLLRLQYRTRAWRRLLEAVRSGVRSGDPLSRTLGRSPHLFSRAYVETLQWAETTGSADDLALALRLAAGDAAPRPVIERVIVRELDRRSDAGEFPRAAR